VAGSGSQWSRRGFAASVASLGTVFAAAGAPVSLYETYREQDGLTNAGLSVAAVAYFAAVACALLVLGRLSDHLGRRPLTAASLGLALTGTVVLLEVHSLGPLVGGRALQGLACGLASSAVSASVIDTAPRRPVWLAAVTTSSVPMIGLPVGAVGAGVLVATASHPRQLTYLVVSVLLLGCLVLVALAPETVRRTPGAMAALRPAIAVPAGVRSAMPGAVALFITTWAVGGFFQSFGPSIAADELGSTSPVVGAVVFASVMVLNPLGAVLGGRARPERARRAGVVVFLAMFAIVLMALRSGSVPVFLAASFLAGAGWGAAFSGTLRQLLDGVHPDARAGLMSVVYLCSYSAAAVPALVAGRLSSHLSLLQIGWAYGVLVLLSGLTALALTRSRGPISS
jgi:MFS family permease